MDKQLAHYYRKIEKCLPCSQKEKRELLGSFQKDVESYLDSHQGCTAESVIRQFGEPEKIAEEYVSSLSQNTVQRYLTERRRFWTFIKVVLALLAASIVLEMSIYLVDSWMYNHYSEWEVSPAIEGSEPEPPSGVIEIYGD